MAQLGINNRGQTLLESILILILLLSTMSGFLIYIYRSAFITWTEYNLNQAINCENSKVLQSKKYLSSENNTNSLLGENQDSDYFRNKQNPYVHRKNRNCLAKAKAAIQKISPWQKIEIRRVKNTDDYQVKAQWKNKKTINIEAQSKILKK